ncbi:hypothetical protein MBMB1_0831 [Methanobacterium sp. MB1]|jgi:4'-phosphopantetheinyl transferase|uniref:4'-phosphopantetheinyl transferase family protein n=1 Tax=Methanobacterium sp. TaxID=2164 RepID=UPI0003C978ED|nr:hypothetical protein MBMB1_0831 [Methanobacterium sp. MB1]
MLIYYMDVSNLDINQTRCAVSADRLEKADRYIHLKDKKLSIGAELLLKYSLNQVGISNPAYDYDEYGKPFLENHPQVHFNLSHSEDYVACAVSDSPVGVDIERVQDASLDIARHYFFGSEYQHIKNSTNRERTFFQFWVLKESYMKMTGLGLRLGLDEFSININSQGTDIQVKTRNDITGKMELREKQPEFGVWSLVGGEYMLAVCGEGKIDSNPELIILDDLKGKI